ncbi:MAG TPA: hypothetical protein VF137_06100 [Candidatus Dormibacteraeota bacterium]
MSWLRSLGTFRRVTVVSLLLAVAAVLLIALAKGLHAAGLTTGLPVVLVVALLLACLAFALYVTNRDLSPREGGQMPMELQLANVFGIALLVLPAICGSAAYLTLTQDRAALSPVLAVVAIAAAPAAGAFAGWIQRRWPPLATT